MNYIKSMAVPNKPVGDMYYNKLQLIVPYPNDFKLNGMVRIKSSSGQYDGIKKVTYIFNNTTSKISALYFGDTNFITADTGTVEPIVNTATIINPTNQNTPSPNPGTTVQTAPQTAAQSAAYVEARYKGTVAERMATMKANAYGNQTIIDAVKRGQPAGLGYTQMLAYQSIAQLKAEKLLPMDLWGAGQYGQFAWVKANYPSDSYVPPVTVNPVVKPVNPNPASTGSATSTKTVSVDNGPVIKTMLPKETVVEAGMLNLSNPLVKIVLVVLGIIVLVKIFSK